MVPDSGGRLLGDAEFLLNLRSDLGRGVDLLQESIDGCLQQFRISGAARSLGAGQSLAGCANDVCSLQLVGIRFLARHGLSSTERYEDIGQMFIGSEAKDAKSLRGSGF